MGVLKWLRRERVTITTTENGDRPTEIQVHSEGHIGTIRTDEYKRDLAEFQARRTPNKEPTTPVRKKTKPAIAVSCTNCTADPDNTFNYEQKSATKYKKKALRRSRSDHDNPDHVPNIQFLFQNQVFMPGNIFAQDNPTSHNTQPQRERLRSPSSNEDSETPLFFKDNPWSCDVKAFLEPSEVDGVGDVASNNCKSKNSDELCEVMSELNHLDQWADDQLKVQSYCSSKSDDYKSDASVYGLPVVSSSDVDVSVQGEWSVGKWGAVPVQVKKVTGVTIRHVRRKTDVQINILRKCRHPNIILLMGLYPDIHNNLYLICEKCVDTLYNILHVKGSILTAQTAVQYASDISNALTYIRMHGYIHSELSSHSVMVTNRDTAKLADFGPCVKLQDAERREKSYDEYSPHPCYVNIGDYKHQTQDCEPLLTANSSESYLLSNAVMKPYSTYASSQRYYWHSPEMFDPDDGMVYPCSKSDVYSLALVLWECCNAQIPFKNSTYRQLKQMYLLWKTGMQLPADGTYPGCLLEVLQKGLKIERSERPELNDFTDQLKVVKHKLMNLDYVVVAARLPTKRSGFSSVAWTPSPRSPRSETVQSAHSSETPSLPSVDDFDNSKESNALYESLINEPTPKSQQIQPPNDYLTPITHKHTPKVHINEQTTKFSKCFTPKSYKPLEIKVPDVNLDYIKSLPKCESEKSYKFDIKNYSLPNTPIARSNKLRKNAWLSGDIVESNHYNGEKQVKSAPETPRLGTMTPSILRTPVTDGSSKNYSDSGRDSFTNIRRNSMPTESTPESDTLNKTWSYKSSSEITPNTSKGIEDEEALSKVSVKPLVAIHERRIYEANKKSGRSMSLPNSMESSSKSSALKPASHCLDTLQKSLPQLNSKPAPNRFFKNTFKGSVNVTPPSRNGGLSEEFCSARDKIQRSLNFPAREHRLCDRFKPHKDLDKGTITEQPPTNNTKVDRATDTTSIEDFIRELIRKELNQLIEETNKNPQRNQQAEDLFEHGLNKILKALGEKGDVKTTVKSFSTVKINGNNKPLVQINIGSGENSVQVLDKSVNVKIGDGRDLNSSMDETPTEEVAQNPLKRCQAFNAIQEARSTEDLYIDDDLSTQLQENFGGKFKLIPLHGSLHEILCERENDCCLIKVKQENGCDTMYFRCDSTDSQSRDAIDSADSGTVVYKRSISLIEETIQRIYPKELNTNTKNLISKRKNTPEARPNLNEITRRRSASTPCLNSLREVEFNIDKLYYTDSSSDECIGHVDDEFEMLEKKIEQQVQEQAKPEPERQGPKKICHPDSLSIIEEVESNLECSDAEDEGVIKKGDQINGNLAIDTVDGNKL